MAATLTLDSLMFKLTKGNGLQDIVYEDHTAGSFQSTMAAGLDRNKAMRAIDQIAVLGVRQDYLEMIMNVKVASTTGNNLTTGSIYVEGVEYSGVPPDVQYGVFGQDSKFATPNYAIREGMTIGMDKQEIQFTNNVEIAAHDAQTTAIAQKVRGASDSRITVYGDVAAIQSCTKFTLKIKPNNDGIFLVRAGAVIWMQPGVADEVA